MVATRNQSKLKRRQDEVPAVVEGMSGDTVEMARGNDAEESSAEEEPTSKEESIPPSRENGDPGHAHCEHNHTKGSGVKEYLKGFGKRVILCTILVIIFRLGWPKLQPYVWPEEPVKEGKLYVLTEKSFRGHVSRGDHFVMMYAPWCGHCQQLKPIWEKVAKSPGVSGVKVGKVDCTANQDLCKQHQVHGYPTLLYFRNGENLGKFEGDKTVEGLKRYLKQMAPNQTKPKKADKKKKSTEL